MIESDTAAQTHAIPAERVLAERWADFTKALAIYPATNVRVQQNLAAMLDALERALSSQTNPEDADAGSGVSIFFRDGILVYREVEEAVGEGTNLAWLQARLTAAALAGVTFQSDVGTDALIEFTKELLAVFLRKLPDPTFETLWPHDFQGLTLIDRRFEGGFGGSQPVAPFRGGHAERRSPEAGEPNLLQALLTDEAILNRLRQLDAKVTQDDSASGETVAATDLLDRIVQDMPAETMRDRPTLVKAVCEVLGTIQGRLSVPGQEGAAADEMMLRAVVHSVSRTYFSRQGPDSMRWALDEVLPEAAVSPPKRGHAGDDQIDGDVDALLREITRLPGQLNADLSEGQAELPAEQLAVLLHYLVHVPEPTQVIGLEIALRRLLADPGPDALAILREHLRADGRTRDEGSGPSPILTLLRSVQRTDLLRKCGVLRSEWVAQIFPQFFMLFLESVDPRKHSGLSEIDAICQEVGTQRFVDALPALESDGFPAPAATAAEFLTKPHRVRLPLARLLLQLYGGSIRTEVVQFLRKLDLDAPEAFVLYQVTDPSYMTGEYLKGLIDLCLGRIPAERLHLLIADVLCRHIRGTQESEATSQARMESIRNLGRFPSANSWFMLNELARAAWNPFARREPAPVRRLARSIQKHHQAA